MTEEKAVEPEVTTTDANASPEVQPEATKPDGEEPEVEIKGSEADPSTAVEDPSEDPEPKGVKERIGELTRLRREAERDRDFWRNKAEAPSESKLEPVKTLADFDYDEGKYAAYMSDRATKTAEQATLGVMAKFGQEETAERREMRFTAREADFAKTVKDYQEVTRGDVQISASMAEAIKGSDDGPAVAYFLGNNTDLAAQIAQLSPIAAAREIGRIEGQLNSEAGKAKSKTVSEAPPPAKKIASTDPGKKTGYFTEMSDAAFNKQRLKEIAARGG